jgi:hypothetical protein
MCKKPSEGEKEWVKVRVIEKRPEVMVVQEPAPAEPTELMKIKEKARAFASIMNQCDRQFFSTMNPENIEKVELPLNVVEMDRLCKPAVSIYITNFQDSAYKNRTLDDFLSVASMAVDEEKMISFKCKRIEVKGKEKEKLKKSLSDLKNSIHGYIAKLDELRKKIDDLQEGSLSERENPVSREVLVSDHKKYIAELYDSFHNLAHKRAQDAEPTYRHNLRLRLSLAKGHIEAFRKAKGDDKLLNELFFASVSLVETFGHAVDFYADSQYWEKLVDTGKPLKQDMDKNFKKWEKAFKKYSN